MFFKMQFLYPEVLYALFALIIPIVVHLFHLRKFKKQEFTNIAFLKKIKLQTRQSAVLKKWLILTLRLLALSCIIMAFAQPYFSNQKIKNTTPEVVIYIDNSFSMKALGPNGALLERSVQEVLNHLDEKLNVNVFTNTKTYRNRRLKTLQDELLDIECVAHQLDIKTVISKGKMLFSKSTSNPKYFIIISDFQQTNNSFETIKKDTNISLFLIHKKPINTENFYIETVEISSQTNGYDIEIQANSSSKTQDSLTINLYNDQKLLGKSIVLKNRSFKNSFSLPKSSSLTKGKLVLDDNNGLVFDDTYYFNIPKENRIKVMVVSEQKNTYLSRIFTDDEFLFLEQNINAVVYSELKNQDLLILDALENISVAFISNVKDFLNKGGNVVVIPHSYENIDNYNSILNQNILQNKAVLSDQKITTINFDHPIYKSIFETSIKNFQFPKVKKYFPLKSTSNVLLSLQNETPFLAQYGNAYVFSSNISSEDSNFINSPLIVPTFYSIARSSYKLPKIQYTIGDQNEIELNYNINTDEVLQMTSSKKSYIPLQNKQHSKLKITTEDLPEKAGHYALHYKSDTLQFLSYNFDRNESVFRYLDLEELFSDFSTETIESSLNFIKSSVKIKSIWKWFVIFALVFLALEMLILKFFK
jgi:hypothetical protein